MRTKAGNFALAGMWSSHCPVRPGNRGPESCVPVPAHTARRAEPILRPTTPARSPLASATLNLKLWEEIPKASPLPSRPGSFPFSPSIPWSGWCLFHGKAPCKAVPGGASALPAPAPKAFPPAPSRVRACPSSGQHPPALSFRCRANPGDTTEQQPGKKKAFTAPTSPTSPRLSTSPS